MSFSRIVIYTDGSYSGKYDLGGWCALVDTEDSFIVYDYEKGTTNNRMELLAVIAALAQFSEPNAFIIYSDSQYIVKSVMEGWLQNWVNNNWFTKAGNEVANKELWEELIILLNHHDVVLEWVKGHADILGNEICDQVSRNYSMLFK